MIKRILCFMCGHDYSIPYTCTVDDGRVFRFLRCAYCGMYKSYKK